MTTRQPELMAASKISFPRSISESQLNVPEKAHSFRDVLKRK